MQLVSTVGLGYHPWKKGNIKNWWNHFTLCKIYPATHSHSLSLSLSFSSICCLTNHFPFCFVYKVTATTKARDNAWTGQREPDPIHASCSSENKGGDVHGFLDHGRGCCWPWSRQSLAVRSDGICVKPHVAVSYFWAALLSSLGLLWRWQRW